MEQKLSAYPLAATTADRLSRLGQPEDQAAMQALAAELGYAAMFETAASSPSGPDLAYALGVLGANGTASDTPAVALRRRMLGSVAQASDFGRLTDPSSKAVALGRVAAAMAQALGFMRAASEQLPKAARPEPAPASIRQNYPREIGELISYLIAS